MLPHTLSSRNVKPATKPVTDAINSSKKQVSNVIGMDESMFTIYVGALALGMLVYQSFSDLGLSTLLTMAVGIQCFGYLCLRVKVWQQRSVVGISGKTLALQGASYALRLSSTTWLKGYIPVDETGDWLYQLLDVFALIMVLDLLHCIFKLHRDTYQEDHDSFNIQAAGVACFVSAVLVHPDLNNRPLFDTLWTTALYVDMVAMLPQLQVMMKNRGEVEALTSHFVGATAMSRGVSLCFWYHGFAELAPLDGSFNLAGWAIILAHVFQVLLLCDFLYYYIRACLSTGLTAGVQLPSSFEI